MTTETRNEAAERLLTIGSRRHADTADWDRDLRDSLNEALAAERRATVERIRREVMAQPLRGGTDIPWTAITAILDEEAAR